LGASVTTLPVSFSATGGLLEKDGLYFVGDQQALVCIDASGNVQWTASFPYSETTVVRPEVITPDGKIISTQGNKVWCHDAQNGAELWSYVPAHGSGDGLVSGLVYDPETNAVYVQFLTWSFGEYTFTRLSLDGSVDWEVTVSETENAGNATAIVSDKYYALSGTKLRAIDKTDGHVVWTVDLLTTYSDFQSASLLCGDNERLYVRVTELDLQTLTEVHTLATYLLDSTASWTYEFPDQKAPTSAAVDDSHVFVVISVFGSASADVLKIDKTNGSLTASLLYSKMLVQIAVDTARVYVLGTDLVVLDLEMTQVVHRIENVLDLNIDFISALILASTVSYLTQDRLYRVALA